MRCFLSLNIWIIIKGNLFHLLVIQPSYHLIGCLNAKILTPTSILDTDMVIQFDLVIWQPDLGKCSCQVMKAAPWKYEFVNLGLFTEFEDKGKMKISGSGWRDRNLRRICDFLIAIFQGVDFKSGYIREWILNQDIWGSGF